jgi:hypothetical protein
MFVLAAFNTACYSYAPPQTGVVPRAGDQVRIKLSAAGTSELAQFLGPGVGYADGTLNEVRGDGTVVVGVDAIRLTMGTDQFWSGRSVVAFAPQHVAEFQLRRLDARKTRVASIGAGLAIIAIFALAIAGGGAHGNPDAGTGPPTP